MAGMVEIRPIDEADVDATAQLYRDVYGDEFPFKEFYDTRWIRRGVFDADIRWYVGLAGGRLLGSAAVLLNAGDHDDLVAEVGRLVVHPDARGSGLGAELIAAVDRDVADLSDFAFAECRTAHTGAQKILTRAGYAITGIEPLAYRLGARESVVFVCRLSRTARRLRRNHPTVVPQAHALASLGLRACGLDDDVSVGHDVEPYPVARRGDLTLEELGEREVYRFLRLSGDSVLSPEIVGAVRLEYGYLKAIRHAARYLILRRGHTLVAGLGYAWDEVDARARVFELAAVDDRARGTMLAWGLARLEREHDPAYVGIDVSAHAPRMQHTLSLLGFAPVAYAPSMVFSLGERLDVVKMVKLRVPPRLEGWQLLEAARPVAALVREGVERSTRGVEIDATTRRVRLFEGLTDVQVARVGTVCREERRAAGETVFAQDAVDEALYIVLDGAVDIRRDGALLGRVGAGDCFGEMALVEARPRSASAVAATPSRLLVIDAEDVDQLVRRDPALGSVIYRNIAETLSRRLRDTNGEDARRAT